jgi:hypothetical protein
MAAIIFPGAAWPLCHRKIFLISLGQILHSRVAISVIGRQRNIMTTAIPSRFSGVPLSGERAAAATQYRAASRPSNTPAGATNAAGDETESSSPAVEVTLSPAAREALEQLRSTSEKVQAFEARGEDGRSRIEEYMDNQKELHEIQQGLWKRERAESQLLSLKERYDALLKTEPKPAVELTGKDKDAAWALAEKLGHKPWGDNYGFSHESLTYSFRSDGTVWVNGDAPTSEEAKQKFLSSMSKRISEMGSDMLFDAGSAIERRDALLARQAEIQSSWTVSTEA